MTWPVVRLGDVCRVQNGYAFESDLFSDEQGTPLIRIRDLKTNRPSLRYDGSFDPAYVVRCGDLLIGMDGEFKPYEWAGPDSLLNQRVCRPLPEPGTLDLGYLYFAVGEHLREIERTTSLTTVKHLSSRQVVEIRIWLPTIVEQRRIAGHLTEQLKAIGHVRERAEEIRNQASSMPGVVRAAVLSELAAPRQRLGELIREPGAIIDGPFGSNLKGDHYQSSGIRVIRLGNIGLGSFIDVDRAYVTPAHAARLQRHRADVGDVVIAALGDGARPAGRACLVPPELSESIVKADCFRVRTAGSDLDGAFLMHVMNSPQTLEYIRGSTRGATRPRMNLQMLKGLEIPVPCMQEQRRIVAELDARLVEVSGIDSSIRVEQEAIDALPAAVLRRAFANSA